MGDKTGIEWTDATWNPTTGCDKVSPGCDNCYALTVAKRMKSLGVAAYQRDGDPATSGPGFGITMHPDRLDQPLRWTRPRRIFVNSMSDLFHSGVSRDFQAQVWAVMAGAPQHTFQVLTKRPGVMRSVLSSDTFKQMVNQAYQELDLRDPDPEQAWPLPNVWVGTSVEDQKRADLRIPQLMDTPAAVRFLSMEPLLGPVSIRRFVEDDDTRYEVPPVDWIIVGGESGKDARPMHPAWVRAIRDDCVAAGVPFLFKQWGEWCPADQDRHTAAATRGLMGTTPRGGQRVAYVDADGRERDTNEVSSVVLPSGWVSMARAGKKRAGRELDGRTWDQYPEEVRRG